MTIDTRSEGHRRDAHASWLSVPQFPANSERGFHRRAAASGTDDGSAALIRRAVSAAAVWTVAFGLFSTAEGWMQLGLAALLLSGLLLLGVVASCLLGETSHTEGEATDPRGLNSRRNGYNHKT